MAQQSIAFFCGFCGKAESGAQKHVRGPLPHCICDQCVTRAITILASPFDNVPGVVKLKIGDSADCDFCGKTMRDVGCLFSGTSTNICSECLKICHEIFQPKESTLFKYSLTQ